MITPNSVIYHLITDRFDNEKGTLVDLVKEPSYNLRFKDFLGGNFRGIINQIPYLEELKITHLLISPVCDSKEYHGYSTEDPQKVNPRFGNSEDLKLLIKELRKRDISTILDYVPTHLSATSNFFLKKLKTKKGREWFMFKQIKNYREYRAYYDELAYKLTSGHPEKLDEVNASDYLGFFGLEKYPLVNLKNPEVAKWNKKTLDFWINNFDFNDVRFDSAFIQPKEFVAEMRDHLKNRYSEISLIAEDWDFSLDSGRSLGFSNGEIDLKGIFLFNSIKDNPNFFRDLRDHYMKMKNLSKLGYSLILSIGSHDTQRFDGKDVLQKMCATIQFTLQETPLIYYGQEIPMQQYNDGSDSMGQSRDIMRFDLLPSEMCNFYKRLIRFRRKHDFRALDISEMKVNDDSRLLSYRLELDKSKYYVIINRENRDKPVNTFHLFEDKNVPNYDILGMRRLIRLRKDMLLIKANESYLLGRNNSENSFL